MSASKRSMPASRASDGFATLTADMMERNGATPPPLVAARSDADSVPNGAPSSQQQSAAEPKPQFGRRAKTRAPVRTKRTGQVTQPVQEAREPSAAHPCQITDHSDQKVYAGPDRRKRDVSPVVERRRSVPPRVKVSVRLEQHRHQRLKGAGVLLRRTHQDMITVALDRYLDDLGILRGSDR